MKRHWAFTLLAFAVLPHIAQAQGESGWGPILRVTPMMGVSPNLTQEGTATIVTPTAFNVHGYTLKYGSSLPVGATLELRFWNRFSVIAGGAWSARGDGVLTDLEDDATYTTGGTNFWLAKAGLAIRLREVKPDMQWRQMNASIFVAPAMIRDAAKDAPFVPVGAAVTSEHFGLNLGAEAEVPLTDRRLAFTLGFEDWIVFWNNEEYLPRVATYLAQASPTQTVVSIDQDKTHLIVVRAGLSFRF